VSPNRPESLRKPGLAFASVSRLVISKRKQQFLPGLWDSAEPRPAAVVVAAVDPLICPVTSPVLALYVATMLRPPAVVRSIVGGVAPILARSTAPSLCLPTSPLPTTPPPAGPTAGSTASSAGNALPDPVTLFFIFIAIVMVASWIAHTADVSVVHPGTDEERRGLRWAGGVTVASILGIVLLAVPEGAPLAEFESLIESIVALMLPYSAGFGVVSTIVFLIWVLLGLPLGPGAELYYTG